MSDSVNLADLGIRINFPTWERFNLEELGNDGVVFFQYLVLKCSQHGVVEWTHSNNDLRYELALKQAKLESLRDKFSEMGILSTRQIRDAYNNKITAYRLDFAQVAKPENLKRLYRDQDARGNPIDLDEFSQQYKRLAQAQARPSAKKASGKPALKPAPVVRSITLSLAAELDKCFADRRDIFIKKNPGESIPVGNAKLATSLLPKLERAHSRLSVEYVRNSFVAYCDTLNLVKTGGESELMSSRPRNVYAYFLTSSSASGVDDFPVIRSFGEHFAAGYTRG